MHRGFAGSQNDYIWGSFKGVQTTECEAQTAQCYSTSQGIECAFSMWVLIRNVWFWLH